MHQKSRSLTICSRFISASVNGNASVNEIELINAQNCICGIGASELNSRRTRHSERLKLAVASVLKLISSDNDLSALHLKAAVNER